MSNPRKALLVVLIVVVVLSLPLVILLLAPMTYAGLAERAIRSSTGLDASFAALEVDLFPLRIAAENLQLDHPSPAFTDPSLSVERFDATVDLSGWLSDAPTWWAVTASGVVVRAARDEQGNSNWEPLQEHSPAEEPQPPGEDGGAAFRFSSIEVNDLDFYRITPGQTDQVHLARLLLNKMSDERLDVELTGSYRDEPLSALGSIPLPSSDRARDVDFEASLLGAELRVKGTVGHDGVVPGEASFTARASDLSDIGRLLDQDLSALEPVDLEGRLRAPRQGSWALDAAGQLGGQPLDIRTALDIDGQTYVVETLQFRFGESDLRASGQIGVEARTLALELSAEQLDIDQLMTLTGPEDEPEDPFQMDFSGLEQWSLDLDVAIGRLLYRQYRLQDLAVTVADQDGLLRLNGGLAAMQVLEVGQVAWRLDEPLQIDATLALTAAGRDGRPVTAAISTRGVNGTLDMVLPPDSLVPREGRLQAQVDLDAGDVAVVGQLIDQDLSAWAPIDLDVRLEAPRAGQWSVATDGQLGGQPLDLEAALEVDDGTYVLNSLHLTYGEIDAQASGRFDPEAKTIALKLSSDRLDVDDLAALAGLDEETEQTRSGAAKESAGAGTGMGGVNFAEWSGELDIDVRHLLYRQYRLRNVALAVENQGDTLQARGSVDRITAMKGEPEAGGDREQSDPANGPQASDDANASDGIAWELVEPLQINASLEPVTGGDSGRPFTASLDTRGIEGEVEAVLPADEWLPRTASATFTVDDLSAIAGLDLPEARREHLLPFGLTMEVRHEPPTWRLDPVNIVISDSDLRGELTIDRSETPMRISGIVRSEEFDINRFRTTDEDLLDSGEAVDEDSGDVISAEPIDWSWLESANADLEIVLQSLLFNQTNFRNVNVVAALQDGQLQIDPIAADLRQGGVRGSINLGRADSGVRLDTKMVVTELTPADMGVKDAGLIDGGATDLLWNLTAEGDSFQALANTLNGEMALEIQRATIRNNFFEIIGSDLLTELVSLINPFATRDPQTDLECAAFYFAAEDGVLRSDNQLVIETGKLKIRGSGTINLRDETLQIDLQPAARKGLGIGLGDLASVVRLGGTLGKPQAEADPSGILKAGATVGAAIATSGLSLLAKGLFDRATAASGTACGQIFERAPETEIPAAIDPDQGSEPEMENHPR